MATKYDLPRSLVSEVNYYNSLFFREDTPLTTTGNPSFTSTTSTQTYTVSDNTGEVGLLALIQTALADYDIKASEYNSKLDSTTFSTLFNTQFQTQITTYQKQENMNMKDIASVFLQNEVNGNTIVNNTNKFYANGNSLSSPYKYSIGYVDKTNGYALTVTTGSNTISGIYMIDGLFSDLKVGQEITLQYNNTSELLFIQSIGMNSLTFTSTVQNTYLNGANIYRSNVLNSNGNIAMGKYQVPSAVNHTTPTTIINNTSYSTSGNNGRKQVVLTNGWIVSVLYYSSAIYVRYSTDGGSTYSQLCTIGSASRSQQGVSISSIGTTCVVLFSSTTNVYSVTFDATTVTNIDLNSTKVTVDTQTLVNPNVSIISDGKNFYGVASTKNATYPNASNIRYYFSSDYGKTWTITQITTQNTIGNNSLNPSVVVNALGYPVIVYQAIVSNVNYINSSYYNGTVWTSTVPMSNTNYATINASTTISLNGTIAIALQAKDATDSSKYNIWFIKSTTNGTSWSAPVKITPTAIAYDQTVPSITSDVNNNFYVVFQGRTSGTNDQSRIIIYTNSNSTWGTITNLTTATGQVTNPSTCDNYEYFSTPLTIWQNAQSGVGVQFYGQFTSLSPQPLLKTTIRVRVVSPFQITKLALYNYFNSLATFNQGYVSFGSGVTESFSNITSDTVTLVSGVKEVSTLATSGTAYNNVTYKMDISRSNVSDLAYLNIILGGVI